LSARIYNYYSDVFDGVKYLSRINSPGDLKRLRPRERAALCAEIRAFLTRNVSVTGGHLASNLGVVELSVALHICFDSPVDKIIWDVGHQSYVHKILTGRRDRFQTLRLLGGISGFPRPDESEHDAFISGHSSTSISLALGCAVSRDLKGENNHVVAVVGDGALTGGLAFEGLNNAGRLDTRLIVVLNDNEMSISKNVGALSRHLSMMRAAPAYLGVKADVRQILDKIPLVGPAVSGALERTKSAARYILLPGVFFEELGFKYIGPVDGHDLPRLVAALEGVKKIKTPVLLHVVTKKGKGYRHAEAAPDRFHGVESFDVKTGRPVEMKIWDTYSDVFGRELARLAGENQKILAITASMPSATGLSAFEKLFPERFFDVGIAEGHAVTFAAGLAKSGFTPVFAVYSTFLQRAYDQLIHDVCIQNLHVVLALDRGGAVGNDGQTHQGMFDLAYLSQMPNMTVMAPMNKRELRLMLAFAVSHGGPIALRYPRGTASILLKDEVRPIELGKSQTIRRGDGILIISLGAMMEQALEVYARLVNDGLRPALVNARFVKPLDAEMVGNVARYEQVFVLEDAARSGGLHAGILAAANARGICARHVHGFAFPDKFIEHGSREQLFERYGLDAASVYNAVRAYL